MTAVTSGKVLVTGANGFIAIWIVKKLLEQGYSVRGTIRSESKGKHLKEVFKGYGSKLEIVVVEDITKVRVCTDYRRVYSRSDAIGASTRSNIPHHPPTSARTIRTTLITPAVQGTTGILRSALQHGASVKRVVITSSTAAVLTQDPNPRVFSEDNWNERSIGEVETKGREAAPFDKYRASKTLAERAAWNFVEENKGSIGFDLVVLNPPFVYGPILHAVDSVENLNASMQDWWAAVSGKKDNKFLATVGSSWIDVRDLAHAHVLAIQKEAAGGNRIIVSEGPYKWQDWELAIAVNAAHAAEPKLPAGNSSYEPAKAVHYIRYDVARAKKLLGLEYISIQQSAKDVVENFKEKKWIA
ncbi:hypothetical protein NM688_g9052 [Phlebia brevispora]|uniref:Uncharacterized protein n=1 Tax=Phlebia brevispora TaxID=194682 RepID=A0ACC1RLR3_9APHY|nr:hypothetical protein NM688_g9052 [Phlebia brevispora]